jgi:hypothetical protein
MIVSVFGSSDDTYCTTDYGAQKVWPVDLSLESINSTIVSKPSNVGPSLHALFPVPLISHFKRHGIQPMQINNSF